MKLMQKNALKCIAILLIIFSLLNCASKKVEWNWAPDPHAWDGSGCLINKDGISACNSEMHKFICIPLQDWVEYGVEVKKLKEVE